MKRLAKRLLCRMTTSNKKEKLRYPPPALARTLELDLPQRLGVRDGLHRRRGPGLKLEHCAQRLGRVHTGIRRRLAQAGPGDPLGRGGRRVMNLPELGHAVVVG